MPLYDFQARVCDLLSSGRAVILQAPTGAGKTRAALYPFLRAWERGDEFPRKCIYSVPLRVLADQFWDEYAERTRNFGFRRPMDVTAQTGARPEDPKLEGNLIFTTVDQTLSNLLNIPYALSLAQGNLNAGAVISSYLIFDELHLFDPATMLPTTLHLLRMLRGIVPFLIMTATLSEEMVHALAGQLDAEPLILSSEEAVAIPSQRKTRRLNVVEEELDARAVCGVHRHRSIAICNTVGRAQQLFEEIRRLAPANASVRLLHSRFLRQDREATEQWLRREFGQDRGLYSVDSAILVATQVVEVGLDITSEVLHTELAPAASVVQRAGRCARYEGETGDVYVYALPTDQGGKPRYAPYTGSQADICQRTWDVLRARCGSVLDFDGELAAVEQAHTVADRHLLESLQANRLYVADRIARTIDAQERGAARELIRDVDTRTVIVHPDPQSIEHPWALEGFGIYRGSLFGAYDELEQLADDCDESWVLMTAEPLPEEEASQEHTVWRWRSVIDAQDLEGALLVAANPSLVSYTAETGFRLGVPGHGDWQSPPRRTAVQRRAFAPYKRETFQEHVLRMLQAYDQPFYDRDKERERLPLAEELAFAARRLEGKHGWPPGTLNRLARWIIALHDLGKLDMRWQAWAHRWQKEVGDLRGEDLSLEYSYMAAHTDYDEQRAVEKALNRRLRSQRPNHAVESAAAVMDWLLQRIGDPSLARAALAAIARHHSAGASGKHGSFRVHPAGTDATGTAMSWVSEGKGDLSGIEWNLPEGHIGRRLMRPAREEELLVYLLLVRALRLADQRSQEVTS